MSGEHRVPARGGSTRCSAGPGGMLSGAMRTGATFDDACAQYLRFLEHDRCSWVDPQRPELLIYEPGAAVDCA